MGRGSAQDSGKAIHVSGKRWSFRQRRQQCACQVRKHPVHSVPRLAFSKDGKSLLTIDSNSDIIEYDTLTGEKVRQIQLGPGAVKEWIERTGTSFTEPTLRPMNSYKSRYPDYWRAFNPDGKPLNEGTFEVTPDGRHALVEEHGKLLLVTGPRHIVVSDSLQSADDEFANQARFSPDGKLLAVSSAIWDLREVKNLARRSGWLAKFSCLQPLARIRSCLLRQVQVVSPKCGMFIADSRSAHRSPY